MGYNSVAYNTGASSFV